MINKFNKNCIIILFFIFIAFASVSSVSADDFNSTNMEIENQMNSFDLYEESKNNTVASYYINGNLNQKEIWVSTNGTGNGNSSLNPTNITEAFNQLSNDTTIYFLDGTYNITSKMLIENKSNVSLIASSGNVIFNPVKKDGYSVCLIIDILNSENIYIEGLTFESSNFRSTASSTVNVRNSTKIKVNNCGFFNNNGTGGTIYVISSQILVTDCSFINNTAIFGAGIMMDYISNSGEADSDLEVVNCLFVNNKAYQKGGAMGSYTDGGKITVINSTFIRNKACEGGAIMFFNDNFTSIINSTFIENSAEKFEGTEFDNLYQGGAIMVHYVNATNCVFINNYATKLGGAIYCSKYQEDQIITNCTFIGNYAGSTGGCIYLWSMNGTIENCTFINNSANFAGAIHLNEEGRSSLVKNCNFINNYAKYGGAIYVYYLSVNSTITDCNFYNNTASIYGGAIYLRSINTTILNSNFAGNTAGYNGGAIYTDNRNFNAKVFNSEFTNNTAKGKGGAIYITSNTTTVKYSVFNGNTAGTYGGAVFIGSINTRVDNCEFNSNNAYYGGAVFILEDNVSLHNCDFNGNSATAGGAIISFNDNDWIINSTFTNNAASEDGAAIAFDGTGGVKDCEFTNNSALYGEAISNYGIIYLANNTVNSDLAEIYNDHLIISPITLVVLNNGTVYCDLGDDVPIYGFLYDDNGNKIIGGNLTLAIKNTTYVPTYDVYGNYSNISYLMNSINPVTVTGNYTNGTQLSIKNGTIAIRVPINLNVTGLNVTYGENITITVMTAMDATNNITITIDGKNYTVKIINGTGSIDIPGLDAGVYNITAYYPGDEKYLPVSNITQIEVYKLNTTTTITIINPNEVNVTLTDINNKALTFKVNVTIDDRNYTVDVIDGKGHLTLDEPLQIGNHNGTVYFEGNNNYNPSQNITEFTVVPEFNLWINKTADKNNFTTGDRVNFTIAIGNDGPGLWNVSVSDILDNAVFDFISAESDKGLYDVDSGIWNVGSLNAGEKAVLTISVNMLADHNMTNIATLNVLNYNFTVSGNVSLAFKKENNDTNITINNNTNVTIDDDENQNLDEDDESYSTEVSKAENRASKMIVGHALKTGNPIGVLLIVLLSVLVSRRKKE